MKQFYRYHLMIIVLLATACAPGLNPSGSSSKSEFAGKPDWLSRKPFSQGYYRGIGYSPKTSGNYIQIAKKSALEDLVSEIKVNVSSSSILSQIDRNYEFQEEYQSLIKTTAADEIQEYELVDAWEDENSYWVYYQLSKARYNEIKAEEKRNATNLAFDFFKKAKEAERSYDAIQAMGFYFKALKGMEKYLGEAVRVDYKGNSIFLGNEIYASLQKILDKMVIRSDRNEYTINRRLNKGKSIYSFYIDR
ncbi:MAG: LPP20 family lipoprotein, partial [Bacteroidota bacterium]